MIRKIKWLFYYAQWWLAVHYENFTHRKIERVGKKYGGSKYLSASEGNAKIKELILSGRPFACCRWGTSEIECLIQLDKNSIWGTTNLPEEAESYRLCDNDNGLGIQKFGELSREACENADIICVWNKWLEDYYVSTIKGIKKKYVGTANMLEAYDFENPWTEALEGKKVLVVSPFAELIESQYEKHREQLFKNRKILPLFQLETLQSVWAFGVAKDARFKDWVEAYEYLYREIMKKDFDIALLGCGPFGIWLAPRIKQAGKSAIQIGGALQILFGIKGKRWENQEAFQQMFNEYWVYPENPQSEIDLSKVDDGCYW